MSNRATGRMDHGATFEQQSLGGESGARISRLLSITVFQTAHYFEFRDSTKGWSLLQQWVRHSFLFKPIGWRTFDRFSSATAKGLEIRDWRICGRLYVGMLFLCAFSDSTAYPMLDKARLYWLDGRLPYWIKAGQLCQHRQRNKRCN